MAEEITLDTLAENVEVELGYIDDDVVIIDSAKAFAEPDSVRMGMNAIVLCIAGKAHGLMNGRPMEITENQVVILPPNVIVTDLMISPDFDFKAMFLTNRILQSFLREKIDVWNDVMYIQRQHIYSMNPDTDMKLYNNFYEMIRLLIDSPADNPFRTEVIQSFLRAAVLAMCGEIKQRSQQEASPSAPTSSAASSIVPNSNHFRRFLDLLNSAPITHRSVESYAKELCITPKYLSTVCKKKSGKTANEWISERVMEEITYCLKQTDMSIKEISNHLGFANPSFFARYVREHSGMSPMQMRGGK